MGIRKIQGRRTPNAPLFPPPVVAERPPTPRDNNFPIGQDWIDTLDGTAYKLTNVSGLAEWNQTAASGGAPMQFLTGDGGGGQVGPTGGNINLNVSNDTGLEFVGAPSTSEIDLNPQLRNAQTIGAVTATLDTVTIVDNTTVTAYWIISGKRDDNTEGVGGTANASARRAGAGAVLMGVPNVVINHDSTGNPAFTAVVSGNNLLLEVTGEAGKTINWDCSFTYVRRV